MPGAERSAEASLFLMGLQFGHGRQQRPDLTILQTDESISARDLGLERDPRFGHAAGLGWRFTLGGFPVARLHMREAMCEHVADLIAAFHGLDVPSEGNEVAPVAFRSEHSRGGVEIARRERGIKLVEENLDARAKRGVEHHFLLDVVCNSFAQAA